MAQLRTLLLFTIAIIGMYPAVAQTNKNTKQEKLFTQNVRGRIVDAESKQPLVGVLVITQSNNQLNAATDANGYFVIEQVPVGRQSFLFQYMGYEPATVTEVMVTTGKELELNMSLTESLQQMDEVTISATQDNSKPLNEFATVSARSISVEESKRYAASFADPGRMAQNFMGVSSAGDLFNGIVVRGNSPKNVLWRLEGIEIPNPNHFSDLGGSGGGISMLHANVLGTSDFYTAAFPAEMGNALGGVFDMKFRNGNTEKYEHSFQLGALGTEVASEGPFKRGGKASYLLNYRYSTLALIDEVVSFGGVLPKYQDASIKINLPTEKAGTFALWGLGGYNNAYRNPEKDSTTWNDDEPNFVLDEKNLTGVAGLTHTYFTGKNSYLKTVLSTSYEQSRETFDTLNPSKDYQVVPLSKEEFDNSTYKLSVMYNSKLNNKNTVRVGAIGQHLGYSLQSQYYSTKNNVWKSILDGEGSTQYYQAYVQWKHRMTEKLTFLGGVHSSYFALNGSYSIEPRIGAVYNTGKNSFSFATGLHSKPEHISTYLFEQNTQGQPSTQPNKDLELTKAYHIVGGYERRLPWKIRFKTEVYYQYLYDVPVEQNGTTGFSMINAFDVYSLNNTNKLVSEGTGQNYGIDMSLERSFADGWYVLGTGSIFTSNYKDYYGDQYNTTYNRGHQLNIIGGKEFKLSRNGRKILGLNGKVLYAGGMRQSPIDINESIAQDKTILVAKQFYTDQVPAYYRFDAGIYYKINAKRVTHSIQLDVQNVTNRENVYYSYFDSDAGKVRTEYQLGLFPNISYRIDF